MKRALLVFTWLMVALVGTAVYFAYREHRPVILSPLGTVQIVPLENLRENFVVYGYLPYWNLKKAQFPSVLTQISFFSIPIQPDGHLLSATSSNETGYRQLQNGILTDLKTKVPTTQLELTLTMMGQDDIEAFLATPSALPTFISDLKQIMRSQPIAGANIDIEYVREPSPQERQEFTHLMQTTYQAVKQVNPSFQLSVAVLADSAERNRLTDIKTIAPFVDRVVVMAYDFHRRSSSQSGANAPLYGDSDSQWGKNIMSSAKAFTDMMPSTKLILGVPFYGYEWSVTDDNAYNFTLPDTGAVATYDRITKLLASGRATRHWDDASYTPYLLYTNKGKQQQVYYEDAQSLGYKLDLVKQAHFGGIAIWAMGYEGNTSELWDVIGKTLK